MTLTELAERAPDTTCYIERSKVREILIASDIDNESTRAILQEVDALPIVTAGDFPPAEESDNGLLDKYRQNLIEECAAVCDHWIGSKNLHEHLAATDIKRLILKLSTTGEPKR